MRDEDPSFLVLDVPSVSVEEAKCSISRFSVHQVHDLSPFGFVMRSLNLDLVNHIFDLLFEGMDDEDTPGSTWRIKDCFEHVESVSFHGILRMTSPSVEFGLLDDTNPVTTDVAEVECVDPLRKRSSIFFKCFLFSN